LVFRVDWILPNVEPKCTWQVENRARTGCPHHFMPYPQPRPKILPNILHNIGNTPLVLINKIAKADGVQCRVLAKCEYFNAGGSVKDRIALRMVEEAERTGQLKPGMTLIEPTSGNTGIGLALVAAIKGYRCIIVLPEKMSNEKVDTLRALGAEIIRTPTEASFDSPESHVGVAAKLQKQIPGAIILDQYRNIGNPLAHYDSTAEEIIDGCDGKLDMVVIGAGTGGTVTGIARKMREKCPDCRIVAIDPEGSILADPSQTETGFYEVEGIGYDFIPTVLDSKLVDQWVKTKDRDSLTMARRLIRDEGLLVGGSSGANMWGAMQAAKQLRPDQTCVVILPDGVRNYMSKFLSDQWMSEREFLQSKHFWWSDVAVKELEMNKPDSLDDKMNCREALEKMRRDRVDQLPVKDQNGKFIGMITLGTLMNLAMKEDGEEMKVSSALYKQTRKVNMNTKLSKVSTMLEKESFVAVMNEREDELMGIVTRSDLLHFISDPKKKKKSS